MSVPKLRPSNQGQRVTGPNVFQPLPGNPNGVHAASYTRAGRVVVALAGRGRGVTHSRANVVALIKKLNGVDPIEAASAALALGRSKSKAAVLPLISFLTDENKGVRDAAWKALKSLLAVPAIKLYARTQLNVVRKGLASIDPEKRKAHVFALGLFGDKASIPALRKILQSDKSYYVRAAAAWSLAELRDTGSIVLLGTVMDDLVRTAHPANYEPRKQALLKAAAAALKKLNRAGMIRVLVNRLERDLSSKDWKRRARAAWALTFVKTRSAERALLRQFRREKNYVVLKKIASALEVNGTKRALPVLIKMLKRGIPHAQQLSGQQYAEAGYFMYQVAKAVGRLGGRSVVPMLKRLLRLRVGKAFWIQRSRNGIIVALLGNKERSAVGLAVGVSVSKYWTMRRAAAKFLGICGGAQVIKPLIRMLARERSSIMKKGAAQALFWVFQQGGIGPADRARIRKALTLHRINMRHVRAISNNSRGLLQLAK